MDPLPVRASTQTCCTPANVCNRRSITTRNWRDECPGSETAPVFEERVAGTRLGDQQDEGWRFGEGWYNHAPEGSAGLLAREAQERTAFLHALSQSPRGLAERPHRFSTAVR